jgi:hypothetical protein
MNVGRDDCLFNAPTEHPDKASGPLIYHTATEAGVDERLANGFELQWAEIPGREGPEQLAERSNREANVADFGRRLAVLPVVTVGEL